MVFKQTPTASIGRQDSDESDPPPPYTEQQEQNQGQAEEAVINKMSRLRLDDISTRRSQENTLSPNDAWVHLKLLQAIQTLRKQIETTNGLFGLYDEDVVNTTKARNGGDSSVQPDVEKAMLAKLAEKRWAVYIARAADRFTQWWQSLREQLNAASLTFKILKDRSSDDAFQDWKEGHGKNLVLEQATLPPLDVLAVWHAFMLNPRCYLEDCLRQDMMCLWWTGIPWDALGASLGLNGTYFPGSATIERFQNSTSRRWQNVDDPMEANLSCPRYDCQHMNSVPWTSVARTVLRDWTSQCDASAAFPLGTGYADPGFEQHCANCGITIDHDQLRAAKFINDTNSLLPAHRVAGSNRADAVAQPMPGTILDRAGTMSTLVTDASPRMFPNELLRLMRPYGETRQAWNSISDVRDSIEAALKNPGMVEQKVNRSGRPVNRLETRIYIRKMLSRYWNNSSPFALDLIGAVMRQGTFIEKMEKIDWLHSAHGMSTMSRLVVKYERFMEILTSRLDSVTVPTLDVDLIWHTNQLRPSSYYLLCMSLTNGLCFVDHDDKIGETTLNNAFAETTRIYEKKYKEPYSECCCWYCESIRARDHSATKSLFSKTFERKEAELHTYTEPGKGAHVSMHSVVRADPVSEYRQNLRIASGNLQLRDWFEKATKRARKAGRPPPTMPPHMVSDKDVAASRTSHAREADRLAAGMVYANVSTMQYPSLGATGSFIDSGAFVACPADAIETCDIYISNPSCANTTAGQAGNCAAGTCGSMASAGSCAGGAGAVGTCGSGFGSCGGGSFGGCGGGSFGGCGGGGGGGGGGCGGGGGGGC